MKLKHLRAGAAAITLSSLMLTGCQKQLDPREYGQVVNQVPTVEGADKPFPLPQLDEPEKPQETEKSP